MTNVRKAKHGWALTLFFSLLSIAYVMPIIIVIFNSFKRKIFISNRPFQLPDAKSFVGLENYIIIHTKCITECLRCLEFL